MSTIQQSTKRVSAVVPSERSASAEPISGSWWNWFQGMGSVLELFPSSAVIRPLDPEEALAVDMEKVNRDFWVAFDSLVSDYEEVVPHAANPQINAPPAAGGS